RREWEAAKSCPTAIFDRADVSVSMPSQGGSRRLSIAANPTSPAAASASPASTIITPKTGWQPIDLSALWHYRELLWILAMRDIRVRYKQTLLGAAWAIIQPFLTMVVFTIIFAGFAKIPTDGVPAPVFYFCGLLPWQLFSNALSQAGNSLIGN